MYVLYIDHASRSSLVDLHLTILSSHLNSCTSLAKNRPRHNIRLPYDTGSSSDEDSTRPQSRPRPFDSVDPIQDFELFVSELNEQDPFITSLFDVLVKVCATFPLNDSPPYFLVSTT